MIVYVCDCCSRPATRKLDLPRNTKHWAMSNGKKLASFEKIEIKETHLCENCFNILANMFPYE